MFSESDKRVKSLYDKGIINRYDDGTIMVNDSITRGEVFILLDRILKENEPKNQFIKIH